MRKVRSRPDPAGSSEMRSVLVATDEVRRRLVGELIAMSPHVLPEDEHVIFAEAAERRRSVRRRRQCRHRPASI